MSGSMQRPEGGHLHITPMVSDFRNPLSRLHKGDILLKRSDGSLTSAVIRLGQLVNQGKSGKVHAGIACGSNHMYEMQGEGLVHSNFARDRTEYSYKVYHCNDNEWRTRASHVAREIYQSAGFGTPRKVSNNNNAKVGYSMKQAVSSLQSAKGTHFDPLWIDGQYKSYLNGDSSVMCSAFVVFCYQKAAKDLNLGMKCLEAFPHNFASYNPSYLEVACRKSTHFELAGNISNICTGDEFDCI
jgi:hypothetical protein